MPFHEWRKQVLIAEAASKDSSHNIYNRLPALRMRKGLKKMAHTDKEVRKEEHVDVEAGSGTARMDFYHALKLSGRLRDAPQLGRQHVEKWVDYWQKEKMFAPNELYRRAGSFVHVARL